MTASPRAFSARRSLLITAILASGAGGALAGPAQAADGIPDGTELISKASGPSGLPFAARLAAASPDGRFVLLALGNGGSRPAEPTGPEATITSPSNYVVRDRTADTTVPLPSPVDGRQVVFANGISSDGSRVIVGLLDLPDGLDGPAADPYRGYAVLDRPSGKLLPLPVPAGLPSDSKIHAAFLSADGQSAVVSTTTAAGVPNGIFRGPVGGTATPVLDLPGALAVSTSADLGTVLYRRPLTPVPSVLADGGTFTATAYGIKQGTGAPHVIVEDTQDIEAIQVDGQCLDNPKDWTYSQPKLSADGGRVGFSYFRHEYYASLPGGQTAGIIIRGTNGFTDRFENFASFSYQLEALGATHEVASKQAAYFKASPTYFTRQFVAGDTELITSEYGAGGFGPTPPPSRYTYAKPYDLAGMGQAPPTITFGENEPVDTAGRISHSVDAGCTPTAPTTPPTTPVITTPPTTAPATTPATTPPTTAPTTPATTAPTTPPTTAPTTPATTGPTTPAILPVGTFDQYADVTLLRPLSASKSIGAIKFTTRPANVRPAVSVLAELKVYGISIWKRTIGGDREFALPKPLWLLPQTLELTVQPAGSQEGAPALLKRRIAIRALKY